MERNKEYVRDKTGQNIKGEQLVSNSRLKLNVCHVAENEVLYIRERTSYKIKISLIKN